LYPSLPCYPVAGVLFELSEEKKNVDWSPLPPSLLPSMHVSPSPATCGREDEGKGEWEGRDALPALLPREGEVFAYLGREMEPFVVSYVLCSWGPGRVSERIRWSMDMAVKARERWLEPTRLSPASCLLPPLLFACLLTPCACLVCLYFVLRWKERGSLPDLHRSFCLSLRGGAGKGEGGREGGREGRKGGGALHPRPSSLFQGLSARGGRHRAPGSQESAG